MSDELPDGWVLATLDALTTERSAITDGPFGSNLKTQHYTAEGPRVVRLQNIGDGVFINDEAHISEEHFLGLSKHRVEANDVLVASLGETLPRACLAPAHLGPAIVKADCIRIRPAPVVSAAYVAYALNSPIVREATAARIKGVGRPRINLSDLRGTTIPVAPAAEQLRIVEAIEAAFSKLDAGVDYLRAAGRRLERLAEAAMWSSLLRVDHVSIDVDGLPVLPRHWSWRPLGSFADIAGGVTKDAKKQAEPGYVEVPYLRVANVQRGWLALDEVTTIRVAPERAKSLRLEPGDVLFNEGGDRDKLGRGWVWEGQIDNCIHQNHVFRARINMPGIQPRYVSLWGNTFGRRWFGQAGKQTTNLASISMTSLRAFPVPVPPADEQVAIVAEIEAQQSIVSTSRTGIDHELRRAGALRRSVLSAAFTGELVRQDPVDEPAYALFKRLASERPTQNRPTQPSRLRRVEEVVPG